MGVVSEDRDGGWRQLVRVDLAATTMGIHIPLLYELEKERVWGR